MPSLTNDYLSAKAASHPIAKMAKRKRMVSSSTIYPIRLGAVADARLFLIRFNCVQHLPRFWRGLLSDGYRNTP